MAKVTDEGWAEPDDPIYQEGITGYVPGMTKRLLAGEGEDGCTLETLAPANSLEADGSRTGAEQEGEAAAIVPRLSGSVSLWGLVWTFESPDAPADSDYGRAMLDTAAPLWRPREPERIADGMVAAGPVSAGFSGTEWEYAAAAAFVHLLVGQFGLPQENVREALEAALDDLESLAAPRTDGAPRSADVGHSPDTPRAQTI